MARVAGNSKFQKIVLANKQEIIRLVRDELKSKISVCRKFGVSPFWVDWLLDREGVKIKSSKLKSTRVLDLHLQGLSKVEIHKKTGFSVSFIASCLFVERDVRELEQVRAVEEKQISEGRGPVKRIGT